jgi:hypothetical protein
MKLWTWKRENLPSLSHAFRTALAATTSILLGRLVDGDKTIRLLTFSPVRSSLKIGSRNQFILVHAFAKAADPGAAQVMKRRLKLPGQCRVTILR